MRCVRYAPTYARTHRAEQDPYRPANLPRQRPGSSDTPLGWLALLPSCAQLAARSVPGRQPIALCCCCPLLSPPARRTPPRGAGTARGPCCPPAPTRATPPPPGHRHNGWCLRVGAPTGRGRLGLGAALRTAGLVEAAPWVRRFVCLLVCSFAACTLILRAACTLYSMYEERT